MTTARRRGGLLVMLTGLAVPALAAAHHSVLAFDGDHPTTVTGRVARILWQNPHTYIQVDADGPSASRRWTIESEAVAVLRRLGWTDASVAPGDVVTITGARARDGRRLMRCTFVELADGQRLPCFPGSGD